MSENSALQEYLQCLKASNAIHSPNKVRQDLNRARAKLIESPLEWTKSKITDLSGKEEHDINNNKLNSKLHSATDGVEFYWRSKTRRCYVDPNSAMGHYARIDPLGVEKKWETTRFRYETVDQFKTRNNHPYDTYLDYLTDTKSKSWQNSTRNSD